jgi:hypothetical protein
MNAQLPKTMVNPSTPAANQINSAKTTAWAKLPVVPSNASNVWTWLTTPNIVPMTPNANQGSVSSMTA